MYGNQGKDWLEWAKPVERRRDDARREAFEQRDWSKRDGASRGEPKAAAKLGVGEAAAARFI